MNGSIVFTCSVKNSKYFRNLLLIFEDFPN